MIPWDFSTAEISIPTSAMPGSSQGDSVPKGLSGDQGVVIPE